MRLTHLLCIVGFLCLLVVGCGGSGGGGTNYPRGTFTSRVNGVPLVTPFAWVNGQEAGVLKLWAWTGDGVKYIEIHVARPAVAAADVADITLAGGTTNWAMYDTNSDVGGDEYYTDATHTGTLHIAALTDTQMTGTFNFIARNRTTGAVVNITEGSFDVAFSNLNP